MAKPWAWLNPAVYTAGAAPLVAIAWRWSQDELGANPVSEALNRLGFTAIVFLLGALAVSPLQTVFKWTWPPRIRRAVGLLAFYYVSLHFFVYLTDQGFALSTVLDDIVKRPFITVGFTAWLLLLPLAVTSTDAMVRRLGFNRWKKLHRLAYVCALLGTIHFYWRVKKDVTEPLMMMGILALLLAIRVVAWTQKKAKERARAAAS